MLSRQLVIVSLTLGVQKSNAGGPYPGCIAKTWEQYPSGWPGKLDWGLYWYGPHNTFEKAVAGQENRFYDPYKKTLLYFHGWSGNSGGSMPICYRECTDYHVLDPAACKDSHVYFADYWLELGWNLGYFFWDQFADEPCARDAEQKIWGVSHPEVGLRWRGNDSDVKYDWHEFHEAKSIAELCVKALSEFATSKPPEVRFAGHSLGSQLAAACGYQLVVQDQFLAPSRLTFLDPYFSSHHVGMFRCHELVLDEGLGRYAAKHTADIVLKLWDRYQIPSEVHKSSPYTQADFLGDQNHELCSYSALVFHKHEWCSVTEWDCKHIASIPTFFMSMKAVKMVNFKDGRCTVPSPVCSTAEIASIVEKQHKLRYEGKQMQWYQTRGQETPSTYDDTFRESIQKMDRILEDDIAKADDHEGDSGESSVDFLKLTHILGVVFLSFNFLCGLLLVMKMVQRCNNEAQSEAPSDVQRADSTLSILSADLTSTDLESDESSHRGESARLVNPCARVPKMKALMCISASNHSDEELE